MGPSFFHSPGVAVSRRDMFTQRDDSARGVADGHDKKSGRKFQKNKKVTEIVNEFQTLTKHKNQQNISSCAKLSTSLETLEQPKPSADHLYQAQEPVCKVPRSYLRHGEGFIKKWPSTPNLNTASEQNYRYLMMERTMTGEPLQEKGLTEQINK